MGTFIILIVESAVCLALFYLVYKWLLSKETFHRFNRIALLGMLLFSVLLPLLATLLEASFMPRVDILIDAPMAVAAVGVNPAENPESNPGLFWKLLLIGYYIGFVAVLIHQTVTLTSMLRLIRQSRKTQLEHGKVLCIHNRPIGPFSWMKYIVVSEKDRDDNGDIILVHEQTHIRLNHTFDILLAELCLLVQWFNPAAWLLKKELQAIHEFEADEKVLRHGIDAKKYQLLLIEKAVGSRLYSIANSFHHSSLKTRITMMSKRKSNPWARLKYASVLPLATVVLLGFAQPEFTFVKAATAGEIDALLSMADKPAAPGTNATDKSSGKSANPATSTENSSTDKETVVVTKKSTAPAILDLQVSGTVVNASTKAPISDVNIIEINAEGRNVGGTSTGKDGSFSLTVKSSDHSLVFSHISYEVVGAPVQKKMDVALTEKKIIMDETTVIGYPKQEKVQVTEKPKEVYTSVEQMPEFPGGNQALMTYIRSELIYPVTAVQKGIEGKVVCSMVIDENGKVTDVNVVRGVDPLLDNEAVRIVSKMQDWIPGKQNGKNCSVKFVFPITFKLQK